jgi:ATP-dependent Clp protease ATP-binding subunit ClpC
MDDMILQELKRTVEQAVRPVRATMARKRQMREELLAHLTAIFEEEAETLGDDRPALDQVKRRFGDPRELTSELQESVSQWQRVCSTIEKYNFQSGQPVLHLAATSVLWACLMGVAMLLAGVSISVLRGRPNDLGMFAHVSVVASVAVATFMFLFLFLSERIGRVLYGHEADRSLSKAVLYCLASLAVLPAFAFLSYLAGSCDFAASLAHLRLACYFAPVTPLILLLMARVMIEEVRYKEHWASLEIESSRRNPT